MASNITQVSTYRVFDLEDQEKKWYAHSCTVNVVLKEFSTQKAEENSVDVIIPLKNFGKEHGDSRLTVHVYPCCFAAAESDDVSAPEIYLGFMISLESTERSLRVSAGISSKLFNQNDDFLGRGASSTDTLFFNKELDEAHETSLLPLMLHEELFKHALFVGDIVRVQFRVSFDIEAVSDEPAPDRLRSPLDALGFSLWDKCESLIEGKDAGDFQLITSDGRIFGVHKFLFSLRSDVFKAMFTSNSKEAQTGKCEITDVDGTTLKALIRFCYGENYWKPELAEKLLVVADKYRIDDLRKACIRELIPQISFRNAVRFLKLADLHSIEELKDKILQFIVSDLEGFCLAGCWSDLRKDDALFDLVQTAIEAHQKSKKQKTEH